MSNRFRASYAFIAAFIFDLRKNRFIELGDQNTVSCSYWQSLLRLGTVSAVSSGMLNNTAVVTTLMESVLKNPFHAPKKLLIPLSYFSIIGGTLTLIGTATNLVVSGLLEEQGYPRLTIFAFFPAGASLLVGSGLIVMIASRWLPDEPVKADSLRDYVLDAEVDVGSKLVGKSVLNNGLRSLDGIFLTEIIRDKQLMSPVSPSELILSGEKLVFSATSRK
ncbi:SLC13 family permease [Vibrio chagasii]|uniref:SLC13 family permease n=1 Tax=Vibrio chagasii TaxID=170679 RepID=UPI0038CD3772